MDRKTNIHISISIATLVTVIVQICVIVWFASELNQRVLSLEKCKIEIVGKAEACEKKVIEIEKDFAVHSSDGMRHKTRIERGKP